MLQPPVAVGVIINRRFDTNIGGILHQKNDLQKGQAVFSQVNGTCPILLLVFGYYDRHSENHRRLITILIDFGGTKFGMIQIP
jgi:hypothetical protein